MATGDPARILYVLKLVDSTAEATRALAPADPDPFVSAWLRKVRSKMRPCGCQPGQPAPVPEPPPPIALSGPPSLRELRQLRPNFG